MNIFSYSYQPLWTSLWPPVIISSTGLFVSAHFLYMKDIYNSWPDTGILNIFSKLALLLIFCKRWNFIFSWSDLFLWILSFGLHSDKASRTSLVFQWLRICLQCRGHGFNPCSRKIPHTKQQLGPCITTTEHTCCNYWSPRTQEPVLCNNRGHHNEKPAQRNKSSSHPLRLEKVCIQQQGPSTAIKKERQRFKRQSAKEKKKLPNQEFSSSV